jgi:alkanesulfonate monooxygenase SsuD/methylene tetrahydromethanopterin reductase-like flavin-dependent oxidoreductase (luciferase family)
MSSVAHRCALGWLRGEGPATHLPQQRATYPVPIYLGALTSPTVELAGEVADGLMPFLWSAERIARSKAWISRGRAKIAGRAKLEITLGLPTFVGSDMAALRRPPAPILTSIRRSHSSSISCASAVSAPKRKRQSKAPQQRR